MLESINISDCTSVEEAIKVAKMDYSVTTEKLITESGMDTNSFATLSKEKNAIYGFVSKTYPVFQNTEVFTFADDLMKQDSELAFDSAGVLKSGERSFMALSYPERKIMDDIYNSQLIIVNSFDGKSGIKICFLPKRICCSNKINMAFIKAKERWTIRHSRYSEERIHEAVASIKEADLFWKL